MGLVQVDYNISSMCNHAHFGPDCLENNLDFGPETALVGFES